MKKLGGRLAMAAGVVTTLLACSGAHAKSWLCIGENAGGLAWRDGKWKGTAFSDRTKYIIKPVDLTDEFTKKMYEMKMDGINESEKTEYRYQMQEMGEKFPINFCRDFVTMGGNSFVICKREPATELVVDQFQIDLQTMQFQAIRPGTVAWKDDYNRHREVNDDAEIEQGVCSSL
jgi:hypothetical protein